MGDYFIRESHTLQTLDSGEGCPNCSSPSSSDGEIFPWCSLACKDGTDL